jgi:hypothetical protein
MVTRRLLGSARRKNFFPRQQVGRALIPWVYSEWHSVRLQVGAASRLDAMYDVLLS